MTNWPTKEEYRRAMRDWRNNLVDPTLRASQMLLDPAGNPRNREGAGLYVTVFQLGDWMLRCFHADPKANTKPPADIEERYQAIANFYQQFNTQIGALVPVELLRQGVRVGQRVVPLVKMRYLRGAIPLGEYIAPQAMHGNGALMRQLASAWLRMITAMEQANMAHGDLDLTNVMVEAPTGTPILRLVDYDNMFVPALAGRAQIEGGHPPFQHPGINPRAFDATMDRFSALSIYLSLLALAQEPTLYEEYQADESARLLFDVQDYQEFRLGTSKVTKLHKRLGGPVAPYLDALVESLRTNSMPPRLDAISTVVVSAPNPSAQPIAGGYRPLPPPPPPPPIHHYTPQAVPQPLPPAKPADNTTSPQISNLYRQNLIPTKPNNQNRNIILIAVAVILVIIVLAVISNSGSANTTSGIMNLSPSAWLNTLLSFGRHTAALS